MDLQHDEVHKADSPFGWTTLVSLLFIGVALYRCFQPAPNDYRWLSPIAAVVLYFYLHMVASVRYGDVVKVLRNECGRLDNECKAKAEEARLTRKYIAEFPDQERVLGDLRDAGSVVRAAYREKWHLLEYGLWGNGANKCDPASVEKNRIQFQQALRTADAAIYQAEQRLRDLHECALACHREDVYSKWQDYAWPGKDTSGLTNEI